MSVMPGQSAAPPGPLPPRRRPNNHHENEVESLPFFHGLFKCQEEIANLMVPYLHTDRCFLLRNSSGGPGNYTLSITHQGGIKHIRIFKTNNTFYLEDKVHFATVQKLVEFYAKTDIPNIEKVQGVRLKYPILKQKDNWMDTPIPVPRSKDEAVSNLPANNINKTDANFNSLPVNLSQGATPLVGHREKSVSESDKHDTDIKLPISPQKKKKFFQRRNSKENILDNVSSPSQMKKLDKKTKAKSGSKENIISSQASSANTSPTHGSNPDFHLNRPPLPIPRPQNDVPVTNATGPYSVPRDIDTDRTSDLVDHLTIEDTRQKLKMCPCGLPLEESHLHSGWRVHRIKDGADKGKIFFQQGNETAWVLPSDIYELLTDTQKMFIERVKKGKFGRSHLSTSGLPGPVKSPQLKAKPNGNTLPLLQPAPPSLNELKQHKLYKSDNGASTGSESESGIGSGHSGIFRSGLRQGVSNDSLDDLARSNGDKGETIGQSVAQRIAAINSS